MSIERLTEEYKVIKRFESFVLGFCKCGCNKEIQIRNKQRKLAIYAHGHNTRGKKRFNPSGENAPNYKGGIVKSGKYRAILKPDHPFKSSTGYVREHRLIYEHYLKILFDEDVYIPKDIDIHHIIPVDKGGTNALINLTCVTRSEHTKIHNPFVDRTDFKCIVPDCKNPYETFVTKKGYPHWYKYKDGWMCSRCYDRIIRVIDYKKEYEKNREKSKKKALEYHYKNRERILQQMKERYWKKKREKNNLSSLDNYT